MCLYPVGRLHGPDLAEKTARQLEINWSRNP
jgi:hypothetical protein